MNGDDPPCSQTDPLGLARFLKQKVSETKTSTENTRVATIGSDRGASQPATNAVPTGGASRPTSGASLVEHAEEHYKPSHVSLVGAAHGERWCFPGGSKPPDGSGAARRDFDPDEQGVPFSSLTLDFLYSFLFLLLR